MINNCFLLQSMLLRHSVQLSLKTYNFTLSLQRLLFLLDLMYQEQYVNCFLKTIEKQIYESIVIKFNPRTSGNHDIKVLYLHKQCAVIDSIYLSTHHFTEVFRTKQLSSSNELIIFYRSLNWRRRKNQTKLLRPRQTHKIIYWLKYPLPVTFVVEMAS